MTDEEQDRLELEVIKRTEAALEAVRDLIRLSAPLVGFSATCSGADYFRLVSEAYAALVKAKEGATSWR